MNRTDVVVIGAGQAGLVMSRALSRMGIDHVVLERGRVGERWLSRGWKALNLLTNNAMSTLPGLPQTNADPEGFMTARAFGRYLDDYRKKIAAPVKSEADITSLRHDSEGYRLATHAGIWRSRAVVIATGACDTPFRPAIAQKLSARIRQVDTSDYVEPGQLPAGGVLVVGASATGAQLAEEIHASGRPVTLAVGAHTRMPRRYRGGDIFSRMSASGILDDSCLEDGNPIAARHQPSLQLVGRPDWRDLNLDILHAQGIRLMGRLAAIEDNVAAFNDDLARTTCASHTRMLRTLDRIDRYIAAQGVPAAPADAASRMPLRASGGGGAIDLDRDGIRSVVWATGYVRRYPWLHAPVLDSRGEIIHHGGVTPLPGLYVLGLTFQRRRRSHFIDGCGYDAEDLAPMLRLHLEGTATQAA